MFASGFAFLSLLRTSDEVKKRGRAEIGKWARDFLQKLKRESTRNEKCRLIASVERLEFGNDWNAVQWQYCRFVGDEGIIYDEEKNELERFKQKSVQRKILGRDPNLKNLEISRWEIRAEEGIWKLGNQIERKIIFEGGEAVIFSEKFGNLECAVRVQVFDPFLFTDHFGAGEIELKTHLYSGDINVK